jgi:mRNA interferase MazF
MLIMREGSIILTAIPQAEGKLKLRPAVVLKIMPYYNDYLVCGISSQITQFIPGFDELLKENDIDFHESGLLKESVIRLGFLAVLPKKNIAGSIGHLTSERHYKLLNNLSDYLLKK